MDRRHRLRRADPGQPALNRDTLRVAVLGSGVAGAGTAYALTRAGASCTIVDAAATGTATAAGAGIIQPWSSSVGGAFYRLYAAGAEHYPGLLAELDRVAPGLGTEQTGYRRTGALVVNADESRLVEAADRLASRADAAPAMGRVRRVAGAEARELFPPLAPGLGGILIPGGARVDGRMLRSALLEAARHSGAVMLPGRAALSLSERNTGHGVAVTVDGTPLEADAVVIATGAWTRAVLEPLGVCLDLRPQRGQITHLRVTADTTTWPSVHPLAPHYLVAFDDSRVVVGATRETGSGFDPRVTAAGQLQVLRDALTVAPGLADATVLETRVGLRPLPERELPFVGALPGHPGVFVNAGFGAAGLTMGPYVGALLARAVLGERVPELDPLALPG